jgi:hypothetical protein
MQSSELPLNTVFETSLPLPEKSRYRHVGASCRKGRSRALRRKLNPTFIRVRRLDLLI